MGCHPGFAVLFIEHRDKVDLVLFLKALGFSE